MDQTVSLLWNILLPLLGSLLLFYGYHRFRVLNKSHVGKLSNPSQSPPLPTKTRRPFEKTYRVQGLPLTVDGERLQSILQTQYKLENPSTQEIVRIGSLAEAPNGRTLVATVSFFQEPLVLLKSQCDKFRLTESSKPLSKPYCVTIDDEFVGLTTLYCPKKEDHKVDIIAVSGLEGHAFDSFREREGSYMWLRDSLPYDLGSARIFVYGYDSHLVEGESFQELDDLSTAFRDNIRGINRDIKSPKPTIFVAHSLGGLLVKGAIIQMYKNPQEDRKLVDSICGLLFFGVPNRGLDIESFLPMVDGQPNEVLLRSLGIRTQLLRDQCKEFSEAFSSESSKLICFYETKLSPTAHKDQVTGEWKMNGEKKVLVDRDSATHGRTFEEQIHKTHPINCNHWDMVKFSSNDNNYHRTLRILEELVDISKKSLTSQAIDGHSYHNALGKATHQDRPAKHLICLPLVLGVKAELPGAAYEAAIRTADKKGHSMIAELLQRVHELDKDPANNEDEVRTKAMKSILESLCGFSWGDMKWKASMDINRHFGIEHVSEDVDGIDSWDLESLFSS